MTGLARQRGASGGSSRYGGAADSAAAPRLLKHVVRSRQSGRLGPWLIPSVAAALLLGMLWWLRSRGNGGGTTKAVDDERDGPGEVDERLDSVRDALFSGDAGRRHKSRFAEADYWDERYKKTQNDHYDWYGTWNSASPLQIKQHASPLLPDKVTSVLNIGCGNSRFAEELAVDGYKDVVNIDISQVVIDRMASKFSGRPELRFLQMDATKMTFADRSFDVVFDKGTLDALYTGNVELVQQVVPEVFRVLRPGGLFVSVTFGKPHSRQELNFTAPVADGAPERGAQPGWSSFTTVEIDRPEDEGLNMFYIYMMRKPAS